MPRRLLGIFMLLLASSSFMWAQGDVVLLTVGPERVTRQEFEYHFNKAQEKRADVFVEAYGRFKQKVLYAKELGLDTLQGVRLLTERYKELVDKKCSLGNGSMWQPLDKEWIRLVHISYPLKQSADKKMQQKGKMYLDSIYTVIQKGGDAPFEELPWIQTRHLLGDWQSQLKVLEQGQCSKPFFSPMGIHIIAWKERTFENPLVAPKNSSVDACRVQALEEGLLVAALERHWEKISDCTERDLETYFKAHRTDYGGGHPHFKGAVIHCQSKKDARKIKKYLEKYPDALWKEAFERMPEKVASRCKIEVGMYAIGTNPYVDKLVFKCGDYDSQPDYPYTWVLGKKLKKGPTDYRDVLPRLRMDCLEALKKAEMEAVVEKYRVEINKEILKTVNRAEN